MDTESVAQLMLQTLATFNLLTQTKGTYIRIQFSMRSVTCKASVDVRNGYDGFGKC